MLVVQVIDGQHLRVIHYTNNNDISIPGKVVFLAASPPLGSAGEIKEEEIYIDLTKATYHKLCYAPGVAIYTGIDVIYRARSKLKEKEYSGFSNNCESFANWAITGKNETNQGDTAALVVGGATTVAAVGAIGYLLYSIFSGKKRED